MIGLLSALAVSTAPAAACLPFHGHHVLEGRLERRTFPGPPNYESVAEGDRAETYWLVRLDRPVCVSSDGERPAAKGVREVQLVLKAAQFHRDKPLVGHRVRASGAFMSAFTGHHHTAVLLQNVRLAPAG